MKIKLPVTFNRRDIALIIVALAGAGIIALTNYTIHARENLQKKQVAVFINNKMIGNISFPDAISVDSRDISDQQSNYYIICKDGIRMIDESDVKNENGPVIETKAEKVRIYKNDCPNKICVKQGWISKAGEYIACVPHHLVVSIQPVMSGTDDSSPAEYASLTY